MRASGEKSCLRGTEDESEDYEKKQGFHHVFEGRNKTLNLCYNDVW